MKLRDLIVEIAIILMLVGAMSFLAAYAGTKLAQVETSQRGWDF